MARAVQPPRARKRRTGSTAQRGYGREHQAERERRLALYRPGDICAHGGEQMWWWPLSAARRFLHLPHLPDRSGYLPGLSCARHNIAEGNLRRRAQARVMRAWRQAGQG